MPATEPHPVASLDPRSDLPISHSARDELRSSDDIHNRRIA